MAPPHAPTRGLRVLAGTFKGRRLRAPSGLSTRPTLGRVRENVFNILASRIAGSRFLDLFAGSGQMGIEALSRGAVEVTFVERDPGAARVLRDNLAALGCEPPLCTVEERDVLAFLSGHPRGAAETLPSKDIIYCDPPYGGGWYDRLMDALEHWALVGPGTLLVFERARGQERPQGAQVHSWVLGEVRVYGTVALEFWTRSGALSAG